MKRRILATFLSLCLLVGLLPTVALATNESGANTPQGEESSTQPVNISTAEQFYALADILAAGKVDTESTPTNEQVTDMGLLGFSATDDAGHYNEAFDQLQTATLNITDSFSLAEGFYGIGTPENPFKGSVYGNGHTITMSSDIEKNDSESGTSGNAAFGLFAYVDTSVGGLTFDQIVTDGSVNMSGTCDYTAALIGYATGSNQLTVSNCTNNAEISTTAIKTGWGPYAAASGMVGYTTAPLVMTGCANNGDISSQPNLSGQNISIRYNAGASGLLTYASIGTISNCVNSGSIFVDSSNERYAAGLICRMPNSSSEIIDCDNSGSIRVENSTSPSAQGSKVYAGGIIALAEESNLNRVIRECNNTGDISVYSGRSNNDVSWNHQMVGGIGGAASATYENCTNSGNIRVDVHMGCVMCVGGIAGGQQNAYTINNCTNTGDITTNYADTTTSSYSCIGGIIGLIYTLNSTSCMNTGNITATVGNSISAATYIGGTVGKVDHANGWDIDHFTADYEVSVTNNGTGIIGLGGVAGGPSTGKLGASTVNTHAEIQSGTAYVGGVSGYETSTYTTSVTDSVITMDAELTSETNSYLGGIAGQGRVSATDSNVVLLSNGFETIRPYAGKLMGGQHSNTLSNYFVYSNADFAEKESGDNTNGLPVCAMLNGGNFAEDTTFTVGTLASPVKDGAIFDGWYDNEDCTGSVVTNTTAGQTYYAKWIDLGLTDISLQYRGTQTVTVPDGVTYSNWKSEDPSVATVDNGIITAINVGETVVTATATTINSGTVAVTIPVKVTPMPITFGSGENENPGGTITYQYTGEQAPPFSEFATFYPATIDDQTVTPNTNSGAITLTEGTDIVFNYDAGGGANDYAYLPVNVTAESNTETGLPVTVKLLNENYRFVTNNNPTPSETITLSVAVTHEGLTESNIQGLGQGALSFTYDGTGKAAVTGLTGISADNISEFTLHFHPWGNTEFTEQHLSGTANTLTDEAVANIAPKEPGTYLMIISGKSDNHYTYRSWIFTINKASVTVKADDKTIYVGDNLPEWTYTVSGLASGESLTTLPIFTCSTTNTNTAGTYTITPSGAAVPNTDRYNDAITYQTGTLTILNRSGGSSSSGGSGSSSSNVSGSGDDVSISASGGTVTDAQMESAVKRADKGSTITIKATSSTTVTLPVGGMADAADNDNDVLLDLRYGEVTLTARTIAGLTDGVSSSGKIKVSITSQTSSKDETISDLLDKGAAVFDVSVTVNDVEVHSFDGTLTLTFTVSNLSKITDPHILHILTDGTKEYYAPDSISGNTITVKGVRNLSTFAVIPGSEVPEEQTNPFTDVYESDYYYDAVLWAVANGVTNGTSATTFGPNVTVTRAQMVTFLWRAHGSPEVTGTNPFADVSTSDYYYDAVLWAVDNGVTNGTSATTFSPDMAVTRAQAVTFQWRAAGSPVVSGSSFGDVASDAYYVNAVTWAVANGITNGTSATTFSPDVVVSRAQAVTFLWRELA